MNVHLTAEALSDLETIGDHIARDNPGRALTFLQELRSKCLGLSDMPERFRSFRAMRRPEFGGVFTATI
jgi:plasmid stabilization system protein ParE